MLPLEGAWVQSLVGEPRSQPDLGVHSLAKDKQTNKQKTQGFLTSCVIVGSMSVLLSLYKH